MSSPNSTIDPGDKVVQNPHLNHLERQHTLQLSSEQYERLFFQPTQAKGDLAKRLGNPTLLGLLGFLVPFSSDMMCLLQFQHGGPTSLPALSGPQIFFGGFALLIAGIAEFILGNTFTFAVFIIYGSHLATLGFSGLPAQGIAASYTDGPLSAAYNAGWGNYNVNMAIISFILLIGSLRTNVPFVLIFLSLSILFSIAAAGYYHLAQFGAAGLDQSDYYFKIAGGFGFVIMIMGWYLAIITACASTGVPCPLPIFDLSKTLENEENTRLQEVRQS